MDIFNLLIGLALLITGSYYLYFIYINGRKEEEKNKNFKYHLMYYDIKIAGSVFIFVMIGIVMIFREVKIFFN